MQYILYFNSHVLISNPKTKTRKKLILYTTTNGITTLKKYQNLYLFLLQKHLRKKWKGEFKRQVTQKKNGLMCLKVQYTSFFFATKHLFQKDYVQQNEFMEDLGLLIVKKSFVYASYGKCTQLKCLSMHLCIRVSFPSKKSFS